MMKLVRGYGRSIVSGDLEENLKTRKLQTTERSGGQNTLSFSEFSKANDNFILALWISVIDKIIAKPTEKVKGKKEEKAKQEANNAQAKNLRKRIGEAVLSGKILRANSTEFARQWNWKINAQSAGKQNGADYPKGRWYQAFLGDLPLGELRGARIAGLVHEIYKHIYEAAKSIYGGDKAGSHGLLQDMLAAIEKNALKKGHETQFPEGKKKEQSFTAEHWQDYRNKANKVEGGDFVTALNAAILKRADVEAEIKPYYQAAAYLRDTVWKKVFVDEKGAVLGRRQAAEQMPKLLAVHDAVKEFYKRTLKKRGNIAVHNVAKKIDAKGNDSGKKIKKAIEAKLEYILPKTAGALKSRLCKKHENIDVSHYIRLGKVLHYEASKISNKEGDQDSTAAILKNWSNAVEALPNSFYWSSEGQTHIKQNEAFVRVWRRALAFANRTLKDWADPDNKVQGDVTIGDTWRDIKVNWNSDSFVEKFRQKYELLFGEKWQETNHTQLLNRLREHLIALRGSVFHFKGMRSFVESLENQDSKKPDKEGITTPQYMKTFYGDSCKAYREKQRNIMQGAKFEEYFSENQVQEMLQAVQEWDAVSVPENMAKGITAKQGDDGQDLPLPTLKRILQRVKNSWGWEENKSKEEIIALPPYDAAAKKNEKADKEAEENESEENKKQRQEEAARHTQYIAIKQLYEIPFRAWLAGLDAGRVNAYIGKAVKRADKDAQKNAKDEAAKACITARAANLPRLAKGERIDSFFFNLMAATASEMRVQKDYQSDGEKAKEQSKYIENLKCDIIALALAKYLQEWHKLGKGKAEKTVRFSYLVPEEREEKGFLLKNRDNTPKDKAAREAFWEQVAALQKQEEGNKKAETEQKQETNFKPWLFFLLHLMPVEEAASLRQQIRKWQIVVGKTENTEKQETEQKIEAAKVRPLLQVFDLYIALHDEQFNTGEEQRPLTAEEKDQLASYYQENIDNIFVKQIQQDKEQKEKLQAIRGLREMRRFGNKVLDSIFHENEHKVSKDSVAVWRAENDKDSSDYQKVATAQNRRKELHKKWKGDKEENKSLDAWFKKNNKKEFIGKKGEDYAKLLALITEHRQAVAQVELQNHLHLHKLLMQVLGRLVDFSGLFERDLYFTMLALFCENEITNIETEFHDSHDDKGELVKAGKLLKDGRIPEAFAEQLKENASNEADIKKRLKEIFNLTAIKGEGADEQAQYKDLANKDVLMWVRNRFAHLAVLENQDIDLTRELNFARALMSYDRKLKNAVTQSIAEMAQRNKLKIGWQMGEEKKVKDPADKYVRAANNKIKTKSSHYLFGATAEPRIIYHLGSSKIPKLEEQLQSREYVSMVQMLFGGGNKIKADKEVAEKKQKEQAEAAKNGGGGIGIVDKFDSEKRYGFIKPEMGGKNIFVHISAVQAAGLQTLKEGQKISFETEADKRGKGPKAVNLKLL